MCDATCWRLRWHVPLVYSGGARRSARLYGCLASITRQGSSSRTLTIGCVHSRITSMSWTRIDTFLLPPGLIRSTRVAIHPSHCCDSIFHGSAEIDSSKLPVREGNCSSPSDAPLKSYWAESFDSVSAVSSRAAHLQLQAIRELSDKGEFVRVEYPFCRFRTASLGGLLLKQWMSRGGGKSLELRRNKRRIEKQERQGLGPGGQGAHWRVVLSMCDGVKEPFR